MRERVVRLVGAYRVLQGARSAVRHQSTINKDSSKVRPSTHRPAVSPPLTAEQIDEFLSKPTWNVEDLLTSSASTPSQSQEVTPAKLRHLLRLSALPPPSSQAEETRMLEQLERQLQFVRHIQKVDIDGVKPLTRIEDETEAARQENTASTESMKEALEKEEWTGKWNPRVKPGKREHKDEDWDVLGQARKRVGRFFVVEGGKRGQEEG